MIYAKITILSVIIVMRSSYSDAKQWSVECVKFPKIKNYIPYYITEKFTKNQ
tara:strand:- start:1358 stop:1513 length:156 start_codon:yes stop_codon:yes gene_type:complete